MTKVPASLPLDADEWTPELGRAVRDQFTRLAGAINTPDAGTTGARPTQQLARGQPYFDATLNKPVWWDGAVWRDATGAAV